MFFFLDFVLLLDSVDRILVIFGLGIEVSHKLDQSWMFDAHVLCHGTFSAIGLLAVGDWTDVFPLNFVGAPPGSFFSVFC